MPIGKPNSQTIATQKYNDKIGMISKTYKLKKQVVEDFAKACEKAGVSQAKKLTEMMQDFCRKMEN